MQLINLIPLFCLFCVPFFSSNFYAQQIETDMLNISVVEEKQDQPNNTMFIQIGPTQGNWLRADAYNSSGHVYRRIHRHRIQKFMKKFNAIPTNWRDCDFCLMSTITAEGHGEKYVKRSPINFSNPKKLKHIFKIWK